MTSLRVSLLLLVLLTASYASARKLSGNTEEAMVDEPVVSVVSALPNGTQAMQIRCKRDGSAAAVIDQALSVGRGCSWAATEKALYRCEAVWTRMFAAWHAFQPRRDAGRGRVLWLVKEEGFFLGVNKTGWVRKAVWETE
ncbi:hypothetical protein ACJRO7_019877 [Eucalyptus globulus]|uniref:S-protein homolog n=1 Tax=Eucalyptus globulus TaxID=34317 RepID=A0ABD3KKI6_EUCGL